VKNTFTIVVYFVIALAGLSLAYSGSGPLSITDYQPSKGMVQPFGIQDFTFDGGCQFNNVVFSGPEADSWFWNFGDPATNADTSTLRNPRYRYNETGDYTVTLRYVVGGDTTQVENVVNIRPAPEVDLGPNDTVICEDQVIRLIGGVDDPNLTYLWFPGGETTSYLDVDSAGCYSVTVTNQLTNCSNSDRIFVSVCGENRKEGAKWYFGRNAGLDFEEGEPTPITGSALDARAGTSVATNFIGELQFYTDGRRVFNRENGLMPNGDGLNGNEDVAQGAIVVPQPADCKTCPTFYYIFHIGGADNGMYYSRVDMRLDGGLGDVMPDEKNVPLFDNAEGRVTAVENPRDSTFWLVGQRNGVFVSYHITKEGLQLDSRQDFAFGASGSGYMKVTADGERMVVTTATGIEIFQFNDSLGTVERSQPPLVIDIPTPPDVYGVEFSASGDKVYVTTSGPTSFLYQINLSALDSAAIAASLVKIDSSETETWGALQRGSDSKIYMAINETRTLGVINQPEGVGRDSVDFQKDFQLEGTSRLGLPNFVNTFMDPPSSPGFGFIGTCEGEETEFFGGQICPPKEDQYQWTFSGNGFNNTSTEQNPKFIFPAPGEYTATMRIWNECKDTTITQTVQIFETPDAFEIRNTAPACDSVVVLEAGAAITGTPTYVPVYAWFVDGAPLDETERTLTTNVSGNYTAVIFNGLNPECSQQAELAVNLTPLIVNLGPDTTVCNGQSITLDAGTQPAGSTFQWTPGNATSQAITVQPGETTTYRVVVTNPATNCTAEDAIVVNIASSSVPNFVVNNVSACGGQDGQILQVPEPPSLDFTYVWSGPGVSENNVNAGQLSGIVAGAYSVVVTNAAGCSDTLSFAVNVTDYNPNFTSNSPVTARCEDGEGELIITPDPAANPVRYNWTRRGEANIALSGATATNFRGPAGFYNVEILDANGCTFSLTDLEIRQNPNQPSANVSGRLSACGEYTVEVTNLNTQAFRYEWTGPAGAQVENVPGGRGVAIVRTPNIQVTLIVTSNAEPACRVEVPLDVPAFPPAPQFTISSDRNEACEGDFIELEAVVGQGQFTYEWQSVDNAAQIPGPTNQRRVRVNANGTYRVTVRDQFTGCSSTEQSQPVTFYALPVADAGADLAICSGQSATLTAGQVENATYLWSTGATTRSITVNPLQTTQYTVTVTRAGICSSTDDVVVTVEPLPIVNLGPPVEVCSNTPPTLNAANAANPADVTYVWSLNGSPIAGATAPTLLATNSGTYQVSITRGNCTATGSVLVNLIPAPTPVIAADTVNICIGDEEVANLDAGNNTSYTYFWPQLGATTPQVAVTAEGIYTVEVTNAQGCTVTEEILVQNLCEPRVFVPQAFSPNGDGNNDVLQIFGNYTGAFEMLIYNRWGEIVFATNSFNDTWDGTYKGTPAPIGTYAWTINYTSEFFPERSATQVRGAVMLVR
jgi:gliding motility-associated-like protein